MSQLKLTLDKVGPQRALELVFDTTPGTVNVIHGGNAAGKTKALEVLNKMAGGASTVEPMDGYERGQATLSEDAESFTLKVGKRVTSEGTLPVWIPATEGRALAELVRPKPEKDDARAKARIKALCSLAYVEVTPERQATLAGTEMDEYVPATDVVDAAKKIKRMIDQRALEFEREQERAIGEADAIKAQLADLPEGADVPPDGSVTEFQAAHQQAIRALDRTEASHEARMQQEKERDEARADLPRPGWGDVLLCVQYVTQATAKHDPVDADLVEIGDKIHAAEMALQGLTREVNAYLATQAILTREISGATEAEVSAARKAVETAQRQLELARAHNMWADLQEQLKGSVEAQMAAEQEALRLRELAGGVWDRLSGILGEVGLEDFTVSDGDLCVVVEGRPVPYSERRLSFGQLVFYALRVAFGAIDRAAKGKVLLPLPWDFWKSLDPEHKQEVADAAMMVGVALVTEDPEQGGPIRVEAWKA